MSLRWPSETVDDADWLHLTDGEMVRWTGRPSRYTIALSIVGWAVLTLAGVALTVWLLPIAEEAAVPGWLGYAPLGLTLVGVGGVGGVYLNWLRLLYVITDEEIYVKHGLISRDVTQVRIDRIQNTAYEQSILERALQFGDVRVYTAGTNTEDITFKNVPNPERVNSILKRRLSDRSNRRLGASRNVSP
ncbi:MAG: PH domain-containing protein [Halobacteriota archaeon]